MTEATQRPWNRIETDTFGIFAANGKLIAEALTRPADKDFGFASEAVANADLILKAVNSHDALVAALEAMEWAVPTPDADNDGSCPLCYAGKPVWNSAIIHKHYVIPYVFDRKNHMKVCQLADALEAAE